MIDVSFVMPSYKVEKYLEKCVESILAQTNPNIEAIIVDDGSPDSTGKIADRLAEKDSRVKVVHQVNSGSGPARNAGIDVAEGRYIHFCDPDDFVEPTIAEQNIAIADETDADIIVFGYYEELLHDDGTYERIGEKLPSIDGKFDYEGFKNIYPKFFADSNYLWNKFFKRSFLVENNCRFTKQSMGQDAIFNLIVFGEPLGCVVTNRNRYYHYVNRAASAVNSYHADRLHDNFYVTDATHELIKKWGKMDDPEFLQVLYYRCVRDLHLGIKNVTVTAAPLSYKEKCEWLKDIMKDKSIRKAVAKLPLSKIKRKSEKVKLLMLKLHLYSLVIKLNSSRSDRSI